MLGTLSSALLENGSIYLYGNRCGHNPNAPQFFTSPEPHKLRPNVIQYAIKNLEHFYEKPSKWLSSLKRTRSSKRQQRSEAREREANIIGVLLHYTDLATLRVGFPEGSGDFVSFDMLFLARQVGWRTAEDDKQDKERVKQGLRPLNKGLKRTWRAIANLKRAGYITVHKQFKIEKYEEATLYKGMAAIKTINQKLFIELGVNLSLLEQKRKEAAKRLKKQKADYLKKAEAMLIAMKQQTRQGSQKLTTIMQTLLGENTSKSSSYQKSRAQALEKEQARQAKCYELKQLEENKNLSAEAFYLKYPWLRKKE